MKDEIPLRTAPRLTRRDLLRAGALLGIAADPTVMADERMLTKTIPATGEALPVIGLGTYIAFDVGASPGELTERMEIVSALLDAGGKVIDSSPMYNRAETVVGEILAQNHRRKDCFLATKVWTDGSTAGEQQMQRSAERMGTGQIDLMQVHNRRDLDTHWKTILAAQEAGFIRYSGVTDYRESAAPAMQSIMRRYRPQFIQINYSLGERGAGDEVLPMAADLGVAVLINRPFMAGALFRAVADRPLPHWAMEFADSWGQFFLKFVVSHPAVTCVIPATSKLRHLRDNVGAGTGHMPDAETRQRMIRFMESV